MLILPSIYEVLNNKENMAGSRETNAFGQLTKTFLYCWEKTKLPHYITLSSTHTFPGSLELCVCEWEIDILHISYN